MATRRVIIARCFTTGLFVAAALVGDRLLALVADRIVVVSQFRLSQLYAGKVDADITIFGNSRAVHSLFSPRLAELTCRKTFNAAYNGFSSAAMALTFQDYLEHNRAPKFALFEISAGAQLHDPSTVELKTYANLSERLSRFYSEVDPRYPYWRRLSRLYLFDTELFLRCIYYLRRDDQDWIIQGRQITPDLIRGYRSRSEDLDELPVATAALQRILAAAAAAGVRPIFFVAPYHRVVFERNPDADRLVADETRALGGKAPVLNFARALDADADFADPIHLNKSGSYHLIDRMLQTGEGRQLRACNESPGASGTPSLDASRRD